MGGVQSRRKRQIGMLPARAVTSFALCAVLLVGCASSPVEGSDAAFQMHLHEGHVALQTGEPLEAADAYRRALAVRPEAPEPLHGIARCYAAGGDGRSALRVLLRLETEHPAYAEGKVWRDKRFALYQAVKQELWAGDSARALQLCEQLARLEPHHAGLAELRDEAIQLEAARLYTSGRVPEAEKLTALLVSRPVEGAGAAAALAGMLIEHGRAQLAISVLSDAQTRHPDQARLRRLMERALDISYPNTLPGPDKGP